MCKKSSNNSLFLFLSFQEVGQCVQLFELLPDPKSMEYRGAATFTAKPSFAAHIQGGEMTGTTAVEVITSYRSKKG